MPVCTGMVSFTTNTIMKKLLLIIFVIATIILASCTSNPTTAVSPSLPTQAINNSLSNNLGYAYPSVDEPVIVPTVADFSSTYPSPAGITITPLPVGMLPEPPQDAVEPDPGKASVSGNLFSYTQRVIIPETEFFLTPAVGPEKNDVPPVIVAPDPSRGEIIGRSDSSGNISLNDVPPGKYFLVVWSPLSWSVAQNSDTDINPMLIELTADSQNPLGVIYLSWP
jgi:hypothetical protein